MMRNFARREAGARARCYGLALCFLMLVFFSAVKLAKYHSSERDFAANKVWQQDTGERQAPPVENHQPPLVAVLVSFTLLLAAALSPSWWSAPEIAAVYPHVHWLWPASFLRPPPSAAR